MKTKPLLWLLFLVTINSLFAQDFKITGTVKDKADNSILEAATVHVETVKDSTLVTYSITDQNGFFEIEGKSARKELRIVFTYNSYKQLSKIVTRKQLVELGVVGMEINAQQLQGVNVVADRVPITVKKDTLEFNADSFKVRPDASVEDVLKKLPGVEVGTDGKITVNGKEVNQVLVNGQVFFSSDPTVATKSLPKDIISKIQITDSKTKEQEFTGEAGDGQTKTINLTLKEDKNKGYMGRVSGGYGSDERYQGNGLLNYFNKTKRLSLLASSNNINNAGFSFDEIYEMVGNSRGSGFNFNENAGVSLGQLPSGFGSGIVTSSTLGGSFADQKKNEYEIDANYFFAYSDSYNNEVISRENILPTGNFFTNTERNFAGNTNSNRGSANLEFDIDPTLRITVEPTLSVNRYNSLNQNATESSDAFGDLINRNSTTTIEDGFNSGFNNTTSIMKRLDTLGKYIRIRIRNTNNRTENTANLNALSEVFTGDEQTALDQQTLVDRKEDNYTLSARFRQPLKKDVYLNFGYTYESEQEKNNRTVFNLEETTASYTDFNELLSSDFEFHVTRNIPSIGFQMNNKKIRFGVNADWNILSLENADFLQGTQFNKEYRIFTTEGWFNYTFGKNTRLYLNYNNNIRLPNVSQLQPVADVSNPLNIIQGNPDLEPIRSKDIYLNFNNYNWKERTGLFAYASIGFVDDQIVPVTTTDDNLIRTTTYTNISGNYQGWAGINYSKNIKKDTLYTLGFRINPGFNYSKQKSFSNGQLLEAKRFSVSPRVSATLNVKELLEVEPSYRFNYNQTQYNLDRLDDVSFVTHNIGLRTTSYWPRNWIFGNDITYSYNSNVGPGFDKDALFWNMSLGVQLFKKKATLKVLAYDLLNQNINTRRTTGDDFIQDFQGTVLRRYFMGSLTIKFDSFGGNGAPKRQGGRRFYRM